ncbi:hypothetical protein [Fodinicola acaciae]|uniref:hypothetical protein n=1 Tax=Fodinicola acaciae TaxID=2681555 RepID=UPI0013D2840B|nr:hypothetical protein [Fodinicola acaciae]
MYRLLIYRFILRGQIMENFGVQRIGAILQRKWAGEILDFLHDRPPQGRTELTADLSARFGRQFCERVCTDTLRELRKEGLVGHRLQSSPRAAFYWLTPLGEDFYRGPMSDALGWLSNHTEFNVRPEDMN